MNTYRSGFLLISLFCFFVHNVWAGDINLTEIPVLVRTFVLSQTANLPGKVRVSVSTLDPELKLAECKKLDPYVPAGFRLWGESTVDVRCVEGAHWNISVPVHISVMGHMLVAARPLAAGQRINLADLDMQSADLTRMPSDILSSPEEAVGKVTSNPIMAGYVLRSSMIHLPWVVFQGKPVKLVAEGSDFKLTSLGQALGNAWPGQQVRVRVGSGKIVTGVAQMDGSVQVSF